MGELVEVTVGRIGRAHGIKGEVGIELRTDEPGRRFLPGVTLQLGDRGATITLSTVRWHRGRLVVTFDGYPDRTAVEGLNGQWLSLKVPEAELPSEPDEYFDRQLVGLSVEDHLGVSVGRVAEVLHMPAQDMLRVETDAGERLIPFVQALVPSVDLEAGSVRLADLPGLLEDIE